MMSIEFKEQKQYKFNIMIKVVLKLIGLYTV